MGGGGAREGARRGSDTSPAQAQARIGAGQLNRQATASGQDRPQSETIRKYGWGIMHAGRQVRLGESAWTAVKAQAQAAPTASGQEDAGTFKLDGRGERAKQSAIDCVKNMRSKLGGIKFEE